MLDRDGTLNVRVEDGYVTSPEDLVMLPGSERAVGRITASGCRTVLVTNQRGIARGRMTGADLACVHARLAEELALGGGRLDAIAVCPHREGECGCRKPLDGLFRAALARAPWASPDRCLMIGDMPADLEPAARLGMRTLRVGGAVGIAAGVARILGPDSAGGEPS
nr:HAD-IIIA family hydrolase [Janibacter cremeus]